MGSRKSRPRLPPRLKQDLLRLALAELTECEELIASLIIVFEHDEHKIEFAKELLVSARACIESWVLSPSRRRASLKTQREEATQSTPPNK